MENTLESKPCTDVRYSQGYSIIVVGLALLFLILGIRNALSDHSGLVSIIFITGGLLFLFSGITLSKRNYLSHDRQNKVLTVFGIISFISRKKAYDRIFLEDNKLYVEKDGKKKLMDILQYACNKEDYNTFIKEIGG